jgi:N-acetylglucosamine transport system permease protein
MRQGKFRFITGFLAAPVILYSIFVIGPYIQAFQIALTDWQGYSKANFVGLDNFKELFEEIFSEGGIVRSAILNNLVILLVLPVVTLGLALFFSFLLNLGGDAKGGQMRGVRGSAFYKVVFFLPQVLAIAIVAVLFQTVYRPDKTGMLNSVLDKVGVGPVEWLTNPSIALYSVIGVVVWQSVGFYVVLFSAGMASIPKDLFEAAALDGAGRITLFFRITIPLLWDTLQVGWIYLGIAAFDCFAVVQVLTTNSFEQDDNTTVVAMETFRSAFKFSQYGYASAMGVVLFFMTITFAALALGVTKRREAIEF